MADVDSPLTKLEADAARMSELVDTFERSGFSRAEALYLLAASLTKSPGRPPSSGTGGDAS